MISWCMGGDLYFFMQIASYSTAGCDGALCEQIAQLGRRLLEDYDGRRNEVARAEAQVRSLQGKLAAAHKRRLAVQLWALVQGASFIFHKAPFSEQCTIWYRCPPPPHLSHPPRCARHTCSHRIDGPGGRSRHGFWQNPMLRKAQSTEQHTI